MLSVRMKVWKKVRCGFGESIGKVYNGFKKNIELSARVKQYFIHPNTHNSTFDSSLFAVFCCNTQSLCGNRSFRRHFCTYGLEQKYEPYRST